MEPLKVFKIVRTSHYSAGVFGVIHAENEPFAVTCENPQTVFPAGEYQCVKSHYHAGGYDTYEIIIPNRTRILFHRGNWSTDSKGCVLVGESFSILKGRAAIAQSADGFREFMDRARNVERFTLVVKENT